MRRRDERKPGGDIKVDIGKGTPIWLSPRPGNSLTLIQGTSRIYLSPEEIPHLIQAMKEMTSD